MKCTAKIIKKFSSSLLSAAPLVFGMTLGASSQVQAGAGVIDFPDNCNTLNCASQVIVGSYIFDQAGRSLPFTTQVLVSQGNCLRLEGVVQPTDLELVVVAPNGLVWRNDDDGVGTLPLVVVPSAPATGWYTVSLSNFAGGGPTGNFVLRYGLYTASPVNCALGTPGF